MINLYQRSLLTTLGEFEIFHYTSAETVKTRDATNIPFVIWPDGSPCLIVNLYILSLLDRKGRSGRNGLSRRGSKGGTLGEYASKVSQLIKYCYVIGRSPIELNDSLFCTFIDNLRKEKSIRNPAQRKKTETSLLAIGKICLDFLSFAGRFYGDDNFVSAEGTIRAIEKTYTITTKSGRKITRSYLHHHSLGQELRIHRRNPITANQIQKLKDAVISIKSSAFVKHRRRCMLDLLEYTGARRGEIGNIKIDDILAAYEMVHPLLRLETFKQGHESHRYIPITKMLLHDIKTFIQTSRRKIMKRTASLRDGSDHRYLFTSERTGNKLNSETITNEISQLRTHSGIKEQVCAHMFRHAFITNLFVLLVRRHHMANDDDFRRALIDSHTFMAEIMQWTGHLDPSSLEIYINMAFASIANYAETISSVHMIKAMQVFDKKQEELIHQLELGLAISEYKEQIATLISLRDKDFDSARTRETIISS